MPRYRKQEMKNRKLRPERRKACTGLCGAGLPTFSESGLVWLNRFFIFKKSIFQWKIFLKHALLIRPAFLTICTMRVWLNWMSVLMPWDGVLKTVKVFRFLLRFLPSAVRICHVISLGLFSFFTLGSLFGVQKSCFLKGSTLRREQESVWCTSSSESVLWIGRWMSFAFKSAVTLV